MKVKIEDRNSHIDALTPDPLAICNGVAYHTRIEMESVCGSCWSGYLPLVIGLKIGD
jgi:hypothetical protein